jgi:hypothetical protein
MLLFIQIKYFLIDAINEFEEQQQQLLQLSIDKYCQSLCY